MTTPDNLGGFENLDFDTEFHKLLGPDDEAKQQAWRGLKEQAIAALAVGAVLIFSSKYNLELPDISLSPRFRP